MSGMEMMWRLRLEMIQTRFLTSHKIWDKLQTGSDFKDVTIDIDALREGLQTKARFPESGVMVDSKDAEASLKKLP
ncbi:hypothetical protein B0J12DRAFT_745226 [Macrophomina phaseolina]|uniref:Transcription factor PAP1 domain-containing protein n=1 Tax=Macrophomina phaseolina TaxID=35725 RepID=A0ABQ8FVX0_9PEZI|nr:hypothetical protein B0J12DRAFT_745226 [Macrophomina phaseolina]